MLQNLTLIIFLFSTTMFCTHNIQKDIVKNSDTVVIDTGKVKVDGSVISFNITTYNAGNVEEGYDLTHGFEFFNIGNEPLLITKVRASCNCTVASYPKTPIQPGESEKITLELDTKHPGQFNKVVAVYSNAINDYDDSISSSRIVLKISWSVDKKSKKAEID